jgi:hypothetical protein
VPAEDKGSYTKDHFYEELEHLLDQFTKYHMKIFVENFSATIGKEDILNPAVKNEGLQGINNDNGVRVVNFPISKYLIFKSTVFPYYIYKYTWTSDVKMHCQINDVLLDKRWRSSADDIQCIRGIGLISTIILWLEKLREREREREIVSE